MQWIEDTEDVFQSIEPSSQSKSKSDGSEPKANPAIGNRRFPCLLQRLGPECHSPRIMETEDVHDESNPGLILVPKRSELEREHSNVFDHFLRLSQWILFLMNYTLAHNIIWLTKILYRFRRVIREDLGEIHSAVQKLKEINQSHLEIVKQDGNQCKLEERRSEHEKELLARSRALALHPEGQSLSERELRDNFRSLWAKQITAAPPPEQVNIDEQIENILVDHFKKRELYEQIRKFPKHPQFSVDLEKHVAKERKRRGLRTVSLDNADVNSIHRITDNIIAKVWANIDKKEKEKRDFSPSFIHEILNEVKKGMNSVPDNAKYRFSKDYRIDLSVYLCRMAAGRFKAMHEAFQRANDPIFYM
ncbi:interferon-induced very large GTPase 1-like [Patagioenas fasciata monilis]|uniref:Interferon-induced very large GTPase 1-like n=1 Tax=Patagioenas fasciata monilis TaxID=372326 RepID=A0A1V4K379_PATFA|nr:interferon-induced very large GTPase 1-like [Patagioenas fasciata monilis]